MSSNSKTKPGQKEAPTEPFKRSVAACLRSMAGVGELDVTFASDKPGLAGNKARLPEPPRKMSPAEAAIVRGHADAMGLRLACHDAKVHRKQLPDNQMGRVVFEAAETARVEAIGARRMAGVAENLSAKLEDHYHRAAKYETITDRADAPIEDAVALMVRERLTGLKPPASAQKIVDLWRDDIESKAGQALERLDAVTTDQAAFGKVIRDMLTALDMGDESGRDSSDEEEGQTRTATTRTSPPTALNRMKTRHRKVLSPKPPKR